MTKNKRVIAWILPLIVVAVALFWYFFIYKHSQPQKQSSFSPTIHQLPSNPSSNINSSKSLSAPSGTNQGSSTSNNINSIQITTSPSQWTSSSSGVIVLQEPISNQSVSTGFFLVGKATVPKVFYTLLDNRVGVVSTDSINVINGKFSAVVNFKPTSSSGRLDVYSTDATGKEINLIEIPVNFN